MQKSDFLLCLLLTQLKLLLTSEDEGAPEYKSIKTVLIKWLNRRAAHTKEQWINWQGWYTT